MTTSQKTILATLLLLAATTTTAQPSTFAVAGYADTDRLVDCVAGPIGSTFTWRLWAYLPPGAGLNYVTVRLAIPPQVGFPARTIFHEQIFDVVYVDYPHDTVEWTMVFNDCPEGWVEVFAQPCEILASGPAVLEVRAADSMIRDCDFVLNDIVVANDLTVNDPSCEWTGIRAMSWTAVKRFFR